MLTSTACMMALPSKSTIDARCHEQKAGNEKPERMESAVPPKSHDERRHRKHARERDEAALETMIGEKRQAKRRQRRNDQRQAAQWTAQRNDAVAPNRSASRWKRECR